MWSGSPPSEVIARSCVSRWALKKLDVKLHTPSFLVAEAFGTLRDAGGGALGATGLEDGGTAAPGARDGNLRAVACAVLEAPEPIATELLL